MLLRKRAWDMMREEFATVSESASLAEAIRVLRESMKETPENSIIVVLKKNGNPRGVVSVWTLLKAIQDGVFKDEELSLTENVDWDEAFKRAGVLCADEPLEKYIDENFTMFRPTDPMLVVLELIRKKRQPWALVQEGGKVIGVVIVSDIYQELTRDLV
ncbi:CBS domain-containing protein [Maridesulfovibrio bastinii]|uniref:CBS domain-containing protein n=1 Tax=Maridesulfovibrio bastinii TaxID=47157 RepID=UPI00040242E1|nr:CBS domain-containing protein [Maridesulfovibrio bastinii]